MSEVDRNTFKTDTASLYQDGVVGAISAADLRAQMDNIADSTPFRSTSHITSPTENDDEAEMLRDALLRPESGKTEPLLTRPCPDGRRVAAHEVGVKGDGGILTNFCGIMKRTSPTH